MKSRTFLLAIAVLLAIPLFCTQFTHACRRQSPIFIERLEPVPQAATRLPARRQPTPRFSPTTQGLIEAGNKFPGANVCRSEPHPLLMKLAKEHANYMARICVQGHQNFDARFQQVIQSGVGNTASEICAESWRWQANDSMYDLGWEMFKCWKQSPGHWKTACRQHRYFGADMARGANGVWYACIIVAD